MSERVTLPEGVVEIKPVPERNDDLPNFAEHDEDTKNHPRHCALSTSVAGVVTRLRGCAPRAGTPMESTSRRTTSSEGVNTSPGKAPILNA
jgi:hypothetical protein